MKLRIPLNYDGHAIEWTGKWSDGSSQWNSRLRQYLAYSGKSDDGTFWMAYADFCRHFNKCTCAGCSTTCGRASPSRAGGWT